MECPDQPTVDDAHFFLQVPTRTMTSRPRAWLRNSRSCTWPRLSLGLFSPVFNTTLQETPGHQTTLDGAPSYPESIASNEDQDSDDRKCFAD